MTSNMQMCDNNDDNNHNYVDKSIETDHISGMRLASCIT